MILAELVWFPRSSNIKTANIANKRHEERERERRRKSNKEFFEEKNWKRKKEN